MPGSGFIWTLVWPRLGFCWVIVQREVRGVGLGFRTHLKIMDRMYHVAPCLWPGLLSFSGTPPSPFLSAMGWSRHAALLPLRTTEDAPPRPACKIGSIFHCDNMVFLGHRKDLGLMLGIKMLHRTRSSWLAANHHQQYTWKQNTSTPNLACI